MENTEYPNLIITPEGNLYHQTIHYEPVINSKAVVANLLPPPTFTLALSKDSLLFLHCTQLYFLKQVKQLTLTTDWSLREPPNGAPYETPVFCSGQTITSRNYLLPVPTVLIQRITEPTKTCQYSSRNPLTVRNVSYFWLLGINRPAADDYCFFRYPLANIHTDGHLCTGPLNCYQSFYELTEGALQTWENNQWNSDLFSDSDSRNCDRLIRFNPISGEPLPPDCDHPLDLMTRIYPDLPTEVLKLAARLSLGENTGE